MQMYDVIDSNLSQLQLIPLETVHVQIIHIIIIFYYHYSNAANKLSRMVYTNFSEARTSNSKYHMNFELFNNKNEAIKGNQKKLPIHVHPATLKSFIVPTYHA